MKCYIEPRAYLKMRYYVESVNAEISGVGKTEMIGEDIYVKDIIIFKQTCNGGHTDLDQDDEMRVMYERDKVGESSKDWNLWWHSHNTMGVFWSSTDTNNIADQSNGGGYLLSIVTNQRGDIKTRFDIFPKDLSPLKIVTSCMAEDNIETIILSDNANAQREQELQTEIERLKLTQQDTITAIENFYKQKLTDIENAIAEWNKQKTLVEQEQKASIDEYNNTFATENKDILDEYNEVVNATVADDEELRQSIIKEVKEKVTIPYENKRFKGFKNKQGQFTNFYGDRLNKQIDDYPDYPYYQEHREIGSFNYDDEDDDFTRKLEDIKSSMFLDDSSYEVIPDKQDDDLIDLSDVLHQRKKREIGFDY